MNMVSGIGVTSGWLLQLVGCGAGSGADVDQGQGNPVETQAEAALGNALSPAQEKTALGLIDQICADTWCSGDYDFGFRRLSCSRASEICTLTPRKSPYSGFCQPALNNFSYGTMRPSLSKRY